MPRIPNTSPQTLALLAALLASRDKWRHGYDLAQETELQSGTLYPLLMRLADQGLLESRWETEGDNRRPRHVYRLTSDGIAYAKSQRAASTKQATKVRIARATS